MPGMRAIVFSQSLRQADHPGVTISRSPTDAIRELRAAPGKDLWLFGGGEIFRNFLEAGLVDQLEIAVVPMLLGAGLPLLPGGAAHTRLSLVAHRVYASTGIALHTYSVDGATAGGV